MKMPDVILVMRLDIAPIVVWILELPLDQQIGAVNVIRILLRFEHGLVVVAGDGRGYIVGVKAHSSPRPCPVSLFFDLDERLSGLRATAHLGEQDACPLHEFAPSAHRSAMGVLDPESPWGYLAATV